MKKLVVIIAIMAIGVGVFGQINFYPLKKEKDNKSADTVLAKTDSAKLKIGVYAGMLLEGDGSIKELGLKCSGNLRIGGSLSYNPKRLQWLSLNTIGVIQLNTDTIICLWAQIRPIRQITLDFGLVGSIPTEQRPNPCSSAGHFESKALKQIAEGGIGAKIKYQITDDWQIGMGVVTHKKEPKPEYSAKCAYKKMVTVSAWYSQWENKFNSALTMNFRPLSTTVVWNQDKQISNILAVNLPKGFSLISDVELNMKGKLIGGEWGLFWTLNTKYFSITAGSSWKQDTHTINFYVQMGTM